MYPCKTELAVSPRRRVEAALLGVLLGALPACTKQAVRGPDASLLINGVQVSEWITTAGQPSAAQLRRMTKSDYELVVNLSPSSARTFALGEERIIRDRGIHYAHMPVDINSPAPGQFREFSDMLARYEGKRVLVHCEANMRASLFTFMHRVVHGKVDPDVAYQDVTAVWVPGNRWLDFVDQVFAEYRIEYRPQ